MVVKILYTAIDLLLFLLPNLVLLKRKRRDFSSLIVNTSQFSISSTSLPSEISWCPSSLTATEPGFLPGMAPHKTSKWCQEVMSKVSFHAFIAHLKYSEQRLSCSCFIAHLAERFPRIRAYLNTWLKMNIFTVPFSRVTA